MTSDNLELVANAVFVLVIEAITTTIVVQLWEVTQVVVGDGCQRIKVASSAHKTPGTRHIVARAVVCGRGGREVASACVSAAPNLKNTRAVVFSGFCVEVGRIGVGATQNFERVTHTIPIRVHQAIAIAIIMCRRVDALHILSLKCRFVVVVASGFVHAANGLAAQEVTTSVVGVSACVVVACILERTTQNRHTTSVVDGRCGVVVGGTIVGAARTRGEFTGTVVQFRFRVVVARFL